MFQEDSYNIVKQLEWILLLIAGGMCQWWIIYRLSCIDMSMITW